MKTNAEAFFANLFIRTNINISNAWFSRFWTNIPMIRLFFHLLILRLVSIFEVRMSCLICILSDVIYICLCICQCFFLSIFYFILLTIRSHSPLCIILMWRIEITYGYKTMNKFYYYVNWSLSIVCFSSNQFVCTHTYRSAYLIYLIIPKFARREELIDPFSVIRRVNKEYNSNNLKKSTETLKRTETIWKSIFSLKLIKKLLLYSINPLHIKSAV